MHCYCHCVLAQHYVNIDVYFVKCMCLWVSWCVSKTFLASFKCANYYMPCLISLVENCLSCFQSRLAKNLGPSFRMWTIKLFTSFIALWGCGKLLLDRAFFYWFCSGSIYWCGLRLQNQLLKEPFMVLSLLCDNHNYILFCELLSLIFKNDEKIWKCSVLHLLRFFIPVL